MSVHCTFGSERSVFPGLHNSFIELLPQTDGGGASAELTIEGAESGIRADFIRNVMTATERVRMNQSLSDLSQVCFAEAAALSLFQSHSKSRKCH